MRIAIYDLDRTITRAPTFTPFLIFASWRVSRWRSFFLPVWFLAMLGYRVGLYSRTALKRFGMKLIVGRLPSEQLSEFGSDFAAKRIATPGLMPETIGLLADDRDRGATLLLATAAFDFYAQAFARQLRFDDLIATHWDGERIPGGNCYGQEKLARVRRWLDGKGIKRHEVTLRFVSDSFADAPTLDFVDEPIFVTRSPRQAEQARQRGWRVIDPRGT